MAEGGLPTCETDFLTCALCMDVYSDPRTLFCLHSFCYGCLEDLLGKNPTFKGLFTTFRCPLCQEEHSVPRNGASGFRKDFRIASMLDKIRSKSKSKEHNTQNKNNLENCNRHKDLPLQFYCKEENCKMAICETCWTTGHHKHYVILLQKELEDMRGTISREATSHMNQLGDHIQNVIDAKESLIKTVRESKKKVEVVMQACHEIINNVEKSERENKSKLDAELEGLLNIQENLNSFSQVEQVPETMTTAQRILSDVTQLGENIAKWHVKYSKPVVKQTTILPTDLFTITEEEELVGSRCEDSYGPLAESKNDPLLVLPPLLENSPQEGFSALQEETPTTAVVPLMLESVMNDIIVKQKTLEFPHSIIIRSITFSPSLGLMIAGAGFIRSFRDPMDPLGHHDPLCNLKWFPFPMDIVHFPHSGTNYLVELDRHNGMIYFSSEQTNICPFKKNDSHYYKLNKIKCRKVPGDLISCVDRFAMYTHHRSGQTFVNCIDVYNIMSPTVQWTSKIPSNFGVTSICAVFANNMSNVCPYVVCAGYFRSKMHGNETALIALNELNQNPIWEIKWNELDPTAEHFDLIDMVFDGDQIFVLSRFGDESGEQSCLYVVSLDGSKAKKVSQNDKPILIRGGCKMTVDRPQNRLFIATEDNLIHIYRIDLILFNNP